MKTKLLLPFFVFFAVVISCKKELIKEPKNLIEKDKMVAIMYDLSLLNVIKNQNLNASDSIVVNSNEYIYKKYKIDSLQFAQSNGYYSSDYKEYKKMFDQIKARLDKNKTHVETIVKVKAKKELLLKKNIEKLKIKREKDSIAKAENDSIKKIKLIDPKWPLYIDQYLKNPYLKRS